MIRYLGVWFDQSLTWGHQVGVSVAKARDRLWVIRRLGGRAWGLDPYLFLWLVRGAVLSATVLWCPLLGLGVGSIHAVGTVGHGAGIDGADSVLTRAHYVRGGLVGTGGDLAGTATDSICHLV